MSTPTITPRQAAELYEAADGETVGPWTRVGDEEQDPASRKSRWHWRFWMLVTDGDGATWGLEYGIGLTEEQENDYPWSEYVTRPLPLTRLYRHEVTTVEYRTQPVDGAQ